MRRLPAHNSREEAIPLKKIWLLLLLLLAAALLAGCASSADTTPSSPRPDATGMIESILPRATDNVGTSPSPGAQATDDPTMPMAGIESVEDAWVTAAGHTALVGLKFTRQYQGKVDDRMKKMVLERVQTVEKGVTGVAVTADEAMIKKIQALTETLKDAASMSAVSSQVDELAREITVYTAE